MIYRKMFGIPSWNVRSPFHELERMRQQMESFLSSVSESGIPSPHAGVFPSINLTEDQDKYYIRAELPGISSEKLDIQAAGSSLSISGERKIEAEKENVRYHRKEREEGTFSRAINLPGEIDADGVSASLTNGILKVSVAKAEKAKPKQITIN
ncbi:MAG: Hsp20/alpha crystallin family protein [Deltaproteobacteria bacterium]|nr:Hsp20/alpha crystallin family protein [Deltaproteobacteria bacterium]